jgi:hypothetical protein
MVAPRRVTVLVIAAAALVGLIAAPAQAGKRQSSIFEDDHMLLYSGPVTRDKSLDTIKSLGADTIHVLVDWDRINSTLPSLDGLVAAAQARDLKVLLTPTGRRNDASRVDDYGAFVQMLAARYPSVDEWSFWNEPNHSSWLSPQTGKRNGIRVNLGAIAYRRLAEAGINALRRAGHSGATVLIGETAPLGSGHSTAPVDFYRELFCLDRTYKPFRGAAAKARDCSARPRFAVSGIAHHPYTYAAIANPRITGRPNDAPIGALGRITRVADAAARYGIVAPKLPLYLTESGYQTRPPDPFGDSLAEQARYINESDFIAYSNPRVASVAQYSLRDDAATSGFNTGLVFTTGKLKPAMAAYALPIWVIPTRVRGQGKIFGQLRANGGQIARVEIQHRSDAKHRFVTIGEVQTNLRGYFIQRVPHVAGQWRLKHGTRYSRIARLGT